MRKTADRVKTWVKSNPRAFVTDEAYQLATLQHAPDMAGIIWEVKRAFAKGILPERSPHASSATFFLKDCEGLPIAVFKTAYYQSELAAYRLDHNHFAGVPQTVITTLEHPIWGRATGSCQYFVSNSITAVEMNRSLFSQFSSAPIRRMAILDMRMLNEDRHTSNILIVDQTMTVPIDHGFIFPHQLAGIYFVWLDWFQAHSRFSETELSYIACLDPDADRKMMMEELRFEEMHANRMFVATVLLKRAASRGFSAAETGQLFARKRKKPLSISHDPCLFEQLIENLIERNPPSWTLFSRYVYEEVDSTLDLYEKTIGEYTHPPTHRRI